MAQQNRTTLQALIDLYITTNGNKEITGAQLNEVLTNLNDSAFLQLDELRTALSTSYNPANPSDWNVLPTEVKAALDEAISRVEGLENAGFQTAVQTPYTPTNGADWVDPDPTEVRGGLDDLAGRLTTLEASVSTNPSNDIAFVSDTGNDGTAQVGNPLKPFATFGAAFAAVPVDGVVKALGGSYDATLETLGYINIDKAGITLDITGCEITGRIFYKASNITIIARGATITNNVTTTLFGFSSGGHSNCKLIGGTFDGVSGESLSISNNESNITFIDATFKSAITNREGVNSINCVNGRFVNCQFISTGSTSNAIKLHDNDSTFINCKIEAVRHGVFLRNAKGRFNNCRIKGNDSGIIGTVQVPFTYDCIAENCYIEGTTNSGITIGQIADNVRFSNCTISGDTDCIKFVNVERTTANNNNIFVNCILYAGTGEIFAGTYNASDLGNAQVTNCIYNKAYVAVPEVVENNITTIAGIQNVEF